MNVINACHLRTSRLRTYLFGGTPLLLLTAQSASAQPMRVEICNEGERTVQMAVAEPELNALAIPTGKYTLEGWHTIRPRACADLNRGVFFNYTSTSIVYATLVARDSDGQLYSVHADPGRTTGSTQTSTWQFCVTNEGFERTATLSDHTDCPAGWYPLRFPVAFLGNKHTGRRSNNSLRISYAVRGDLNGRVPTQQGSAAEERPDRSETQGPQLLYERALKYEKGDGVRQDHGEALRLYRLAAESDHAAAQTAIGYYYRNGLAVARDPANAMRWYREAAENGSGTAHANLASMYEDGDGVERDYRQAFRYYNGAAERGHLNSQNAVGFYYATGRGVAKDLSRAAQWYRNAAERGHDVAQHNLGHLYENGTGVENSLTEALRWYRRAAEQGHEEAAEDVKRLSGSG